jgi:transcription antitermination factor NusG
MSTDLFNKLIVLKGARKFLNHDKENHKLPFPFLDFNFYNIFNVNRDSFFIRKKNKNKFYIGDGIRIKDGFFKDLEGVIANVTGNKVQKLHIKSLVSNAETLIKIDSFLCEKINSKS